MGKWLFRLIGYWVETLSLGKEGWEKMILILTFLLSVFYLIGKFIGFETWFTPENVHRTEEYLTPCSISFLIFYVFVSPFLRHEKEEKKTADKIAEKDSNIKRLESVKRDKACDEIAKGIVALISRISAIRRLGVDNYKREKDKDTDAALAAILGNVIGRLNNDAAKTYDSGILEIVGDNFFPGGSNRFERDYAQMIARLEQRVRNLIIIRDSIDKYLPP